MRYFMITVLFFSAILLCKGQVGINTSNPEAILEIEASSTSDPENTDGILIPRVSKFPETDPTPGKDGILLYLNATINHNTPGFYYWNANQSTWCKLITNVNVMLATKTGTSLDLIGNVFNYPDVLFNNIPGASLNANNQLTLSPGIYEIESNFKSSTGVNISWNMRLNGTIHSGSIPGSSSSISVLGLGLADSHPQKAIVVISSPTDYIDFQLTSGLSLSINLVPSASYLKVKKLG
jgi:hypothetical protein